jgi:hypothetical protein
MTIREIGRIYWVLFIAWCGLLTFLMYGESLSLPFFFDDFVHYPFVEANEVADIWLTTDELAYYRPLNFTLWRLTYDAMQRHHPVVDHAINLILHAINGVMVGWLAARLWGKGGRRFPVVAKEDTAVDWWRAAISATLFILYPFSYQAVPWVGSLSHMLVTALIMLSLTCYVQMRRTGLFFWGVASLLFAVLAPFAHENGVLVMPFVVLIELTTPESPDRFRRALRAGVIWSLPLLFYLPVWFSLPRVDSGALFPNNLEGVLQNTAYFLQGFFYPFTGLGGWLYHARNVNDMVAVAGLSGLGIVVAIWVQLANKATLRSLLPWLWCILASLPAILFLLFEYVINGPRLLMVASVGAAWLWTDVLLLFVRGANIGSRRRMLRVAIAVLVVTILLGQNARFVRERMDLHQILGDGFSQVVEATARANEAGKEAIVVNFPSWLAAKRSDYALGHDGVLFWPDYVPPGIFIAVHTGEFGDLNFVRVDAIRPDLETIYYGLTGPAPDWTALSSVPSQVLMTEYGAENLSLVPVGELITSAAISDEPVATFEISSGETAVTLLDASTEVSDDGVRVLLKWQVSGMLNDSTVFVHLLDRNGQLIGQADGDPLGGSFPFELWPNDGPIMDTRLIAVEGAAASGVLIGLYERGSGERLAAFGADGERLQDNAVPVTIGLP